MGPAVDAASLAPRGSAAKAIARALGRALPVLGSGHLLGRLALWTLGAFVGWLVVGIALFTPATDALARLAGGGTLAHALAGLGIALSLVAGAIVTALVLVATLAMPLIVRIVADRYFPALERRRGGTWHGSLRNAVVAIAVFVPAWLASLVLLVVPPVYVVASWCLTGWLNQRLFRYDALAEHADAQELAGVPRAIRGRLFALGVLLAPLALVPIVNLALPLYAGIAFACLALDALERMRAATRQARVPAVDRMHSATSAGPR